MPGSTDQWGSDKKMYSSKQSSTIPIIQITGGQIKSGLNNNQRFQANRLVAFNSQQVKTIINDYRQILIALT